MGSTGPSRLRVIVVEAEVGDGDLSPITEALQNALRAPAGTPGATRTINPALPRATATPATPSEEEGADAENHDLADDSSDAGTATRTARSRGPRKPRTPELDTGLRPGDEPSLEEFAKPKNPQSDLMKFLVVAAWLQEQRNGLATTANRVYTCYRFMKWPYDIDFAQPLRDLKRRDLLESKTRGEYSITHLGLNEVEQMGSIA